MMPNTQSPREHIPPPALLTLWNKRNPADVVQMRAADLPGMVSLPVRELVANLPEPIWSDTPAFGSSDVEVIRQRTREQVRAMDWSMIKRGKRVNLIANPHGFFLCGEAYVAMLEEIAEYVHAQTGARVRLRIAESMGHIENPDWVKFLNLEERFGNVKECAQIASGVEAQTRLGPFWLNHELFNADYFIHTHVTEMRESYLHRMLDRLHKPFGMAYTRIETRSAYHLGFGPRTGQMVSRAVFESDFVQQRYTGTVVLDTTPEGVIGVHGDNDLDALDRRMAVNLLTHYGTLMRLFAEIDECICVFDGHGSGVYTYGAGLAWDALFCANTDFLDLDNMALISSNKSSTPGLTMGYNPAIKALVVNYMAGGVPQTNLFEKFPSFVVGDEVYKWLTNDPSNCYLSRFVTKVPNLLDAMEQARAVAGTDKIIVFDRTTGVLRVSESLARHLIERAPFAAADVANNRLPKWLSQRNLA